MKRTIELEAEKLMDRKQAHDYMAELFCFDHEYGRNLDALNDCLSEVSDDVDLILTRETVTMMCRNPYAFKILMVLGRAGEENPHLHVLFR
ncbi:MAG: barstar family protein [Solobacterium sp.]|nr:barstar family protein [Solobacterium sp.]